MRPPTGLIQMPLPAGRVLSTTPTGRQPHDASALGPIIGMGNEFGNSLTLMLPTPDPDVVVTFLYDTLIGSLEMAVDR